MVIRAVSGQQLENSEKSQPLTTSATLVIMSIDKIASGEQYHFKFGAMKYNSKLPLQWVKFYFTKSKILKFLKEGAYGLLNYTKLEILL